MWVSIGWETRLWNICGMIALRGASAPATTNPKLDAERESYDVKIKSMIRTCRTCDSSGNVQGFQIEFQVSEALIAH